MNGESISALSDNDLVSLALNGSTEAFPVLLKRYAHRSSEKAKSFRFTQGVETDDFYQEGVIGFYSAVFSYDPVKSDNFSAYAMVLTEQAMQRYYKSLNRKKHCPLKNYVQIEDLAEIESKNLSPEDVLLLKEQQRALFESLSDFELSVAKAYLLGFSRKATAEALNCELKQVDNAVQRIRQKIKKD